MTPNEYQKRAMRTALPQSLTLNYMVLGLANESGEVAGKLKKIIRDGDTVERREAMVAELGDVAWYLAGCCEMLGVPLEQVLADNLLKLADRANRGTIQGDGDKR